MGTPWAAPEPAPEGVEIGTEKEADGGLDHGGESFVDESDQAIEWLDAAASKASALRDRPA